MVQPACADIVNASSGCCSGVIAAVISGFITRATVATQTRAAPALRRTRAHSPTVVPVVRTSSTTKMSRPRTSSGRHSKRAANVLPPLLARQSGLRFGCANAFQHLWPQLEQTQIQIALESRFGDQFGLIETTRSQLTGVQRNWNQKCARQARNVAADPRWLPRAFFPAPRPRSARDRISEDESARADRHHSCHTLRPFRRPDAPSGIRRKVAHSHQVRTQTSSRRRQHMSVRRSE